MLFSKNKIRLRFAPSPTGFLHLGGLRSALFGYLLAKSQGGRFILRIEDTDQKREVEGAVGSLIRTLNWVGIRFDEGPGLGGKYGPYVQTERLNIYKKHLDQLLSAGKAYRCFCSVERLTEMRTAQEAAKKAPRYDRRCRDLSPEESQHRAEAGEPFVIRQKMPLDGEVIVRDELRGEIKFPAADLDDQVLIKSDGMPTYQFANVVDDHLMEISHVTRGDEWLPSYPKNILLYRDFGWKPPKFVHLPLILNKEGGGKLSKRKGDVFVEDYRTKGYLPEALINFCAMLGWHPKNDKEIWTLKELEKEFSLNGLGASPAVFDLEKLDYYNSYYIRQKPIREEDKWTHSVSGAQGTQGTLVSLSRPYLEAAGLTAETPVLEKYLALAQDRMKKLSDAPDLVSFLFILSPYDRALLAWKKLSVEQSITNLRELEIELKKIPAEKWTKNDLEKIIMNWIKDNDRKNGDYLWPLRVALTGLKNSPGPFEVADALGQEESLKRIEQALTQ